MPGWRCLDPARENPGQYSHAAPEPRYRLFRRGHGIAEPDRRPQAEPLAAGQRRGHHVRQRRQLRAVAGSARRASSGRRPPMRAGPGSQRDRGTADSPDAAVRLRARPTRRPYRGQPAAVDDGAVHRRLSRRRRRIAHAARLRRAGVARQRRAGDALRRVRGWIDHPRRGRGRCRTAPGTPCPPHLARPAGRHSSCRGRRHSRFRCGHHRSRQLPYEPGADLSSGGGA